MANLLEVNDETFEKEVTKDSKPVVVDFFATWCGPCKMLSPVVEELSKEIDTVKFCKVNVDESPKVASLFKIMSVPTLIFFKNGKEVSKSIGFSKKEVLKEKISQSFK